MVGTTIAAAILGAAASGTFAYAAIAFVANFALSYVVTRIFGTNQSYARNQVDPGVRQQVPPAANNPIPIVYGNAWLGGTFVDAVLSTDNKTMYYVLVISNISPNGQFTYDRDNFYYGDRQVVFDSTDPTKVIKLIDGAGNEDTKISGNLYINLYTSTAAGVITNVTGSAPSVVMGGSDIAAGLRWPATGRQMNGLAFAIVKLTYNSEAGTTGLQPVTFKVSHTLNGTGAAKPGDVLKDYLTSDVYGAFVPLANVNTTACTALNTYSDEVITYDTSSGSPATQPRYRINGVLNTGENVFSNTEKILNACDCWLAYEEVTGQWSPIINKAESVSFAFNDSNIVGELRVSVSDLSQSINQVEVTFPWEKNKDQPGIVFLDLNELNPLLLYPNEPANKATISLDLVNDSVRAQYLANRILEQAREDLIVSFSTAYTGIQVNAGDVISITNADYGWTAKPFRVMRVSEVSMEDGNLGAQIECTEYNAQVYDDKNIKDFVPAPNSELPSVYYFSALSAPTVGDQAPTANPPTFSVTCNIPTTGRVTSITLYYTTVAVPSVTDWKVWGTEYSVNSQAYTPGLAFKFSNVNLGADTYYFAFKVANDVATSQLSAVSSAFIWSPSASAGPTGPTGSSGPTGSTGSSGPTGQSGTQNTTVYLYQWATAQPGNPSGTSTYTWSTATNASYTGGNGWSVTVPANPGTPGIYLWLAAKQIVVAAGTTTTTVDWTSGYTISASTGNGVNGVQTAEAIVYQWAVTIPTISGTSIYTWSSGAVDTAPSGWSTTISDTGTAGQTLWAAKVALSDSVTVTTSTVNWATASIVPFGYSGTTGAVARTAYTKASFALGGAPSYYAVSGDNLPAANSWAGALVRVASTANIATLSGLLTIDGVTLVAADRILVKNQTTQSQNGIYVAASGAWSRANDADSWPELVGLKVFVSAGSTQANTWWLSGATAGGTIGTTALTFSSTTAQTITWTSTVPTIVAGESVWQSDGIYNPTANQTIWEVPYLSALKVGNLSAISTNTGSLTVSGSITVGAYGNIKGGQTDYNTGTGFFLGYSAGAYKFSIGSAANYLTWSGTALTINGTGRFGASGSSNYVELGLDLSGSVVRINRPTASTLPPFYIFDTSTGSTQSAWIRHATDPAMLISCDDIALTLSSVNTGVTVNKQLAYISGSRQEAQFKVEAFQTSGLSNQHAARFLNYNTTPTIVASSIIATAGGNAFYAETGNYAPFTGSHDGLILKTATPVQGDILVDIKLIAKKDISNTLFEVGLSSSANQPAIGVFVSVETLNETDAPACLLDTSNPAGTEEIKDPEGNLLYNKYTFNPLPQFYALEPDYFLVNMNALGEGQINVCGEGGDIQPGDLIVTSSIPGKGMKQADDIVRSTTVAKAREAATFSGSTDVKMIACIYLSG